MPETIVDPERSRLHELGRMRLADLQALYLIYYGFDRGRCAADVLHGIDITHPGGRIRLVPWDRDRYITAILEHEDD